MKITPKEVGIILADKIAEFIGSWTFIIIQSTILTIWITINAIHLVHFDTYPFILLNLFLSFEAAYATPLILMSANRSAERDRRHILHDLELDEEANVLIKKMSKVLDEVSEDINLGKTTVGELEIARLERSQISAKLEEISSSLKTIKNSKNGRG